MFKDKPQGKDLIRWKYQRYLKDYLRCIKSVDESVGRVMKYLKENGLEELKVISEISTRLIANKASIKTRSKLIHEISDALTQ